MSDVHDSNDATETGSDADSDSEASSTADRLRALQRIDTEADQLRNRRERLVERENLAEASNALSEWERSRTSMRDRLDALTAVIERAEIDSSEVGDHKTRLEAQMKTVIAPREAEALMQEMATLDERIDELDMAELEALEEQSDVDDRLTAHLNSEESLRQSVTSADQALERATGAIDVELDDLAERRSRARGEMKEAVLNRYDRVRTASGVAVATLSGHRCEGCHLDLSAAEIDDVKDEAASNDGVADCPNCGRMLAL